MEGKLKILFNEDVKNDAELIWRELAKNGIDFKKLLVDNRKDFISGLKSFNPDLIISDYSLPQFTGMEALVIRNEISPLTPFILVTGSTNETVAVDCMRAGADDYILKDNLLRLGLSVNNAINRAKVLREKIIAEEALRQSELRFQQISENFGEWIWEVDKNGLYTYSSPIVKELLGYEPEELVDKKYFYDFFTPELRDQLKQAALAAIARKENIRNFINVNLHKDGREVILSTSGFSLIDKDGNLTGYRGVDINVTELKRTERTLQNIIDYNPMSIQIMDTEGFTLKVNQAFIKLFGSKPPPDYSMLSDIQLKEKGFAELLERIMNGEVVQFPDMVFNPHDSIPELPDCLSWIKAIGFSLADGNGKPEKIVLMHENITERKQAEEKVINERIMLRSLIDNLPDPIYVLDKEGRKVIANIADIKNIGLSSEPDALGKSDLELFPGDTGKRGHDDNMGVINSEKAIIEHEEEFIDKEGVRRWLLTTKIPLRNNLGIVTGLVGIGHNITERKRVEEELIKAKGKAEEGDKLKTAFLANMSHEIRTPMNGILGFSELLKEPGLTGEQQQKYIRIIEQSGARMLNIINDIIDISKIEAGLMEVDINDTNINEKLEFIYNFFKPQVEEKGLQLLFKNTLPTKEATIRTDKEKVYSILTNLVKNAIIYSKEGAIDFGYIKKGETLEFYVKDSGLGIPKDRQSAIFERFIQADMTGKMARQGAGLGLSISKAYVEMLGGKIWVESEVGIGSTFYFTLPYNAEPEEKKVVGKVVPAEDGANQTKT
jgi:PAS domain S-box-containing protein